MSGEKKIGVYTSPTIAFDSWYLEEQSERLAGTEGAGNAIYHVLLFQMSLDNNQTKKEKGKKKKRNKVVQQITPHAFVKPTFVYYLQHTWTPRVCVNENNTACDTK